MLHVYQQFNDAKRELAQLINDIANELIRLRGNISHAQSFVVPAHVSVEEYKTIVLEKLDALSLAIKAFDDRALTDEMAQRLAQFNLQCIAVNKALADMTALPELGIIEEVYDYCEHDFDHFAEEMPQDPNRIELLNAIRQATQLLEAVNQGITLINDHPAFEVANVMTEGALVLQEFNPEKTLRP